MGRTGGLAEFIRAKMAEQNLSAYDVARKSGNEISPTTITKILNGEVNKSGTKTLAAIARGLGVAELDMLRVASGEDISRPIHHQIYAERLDGEDLSESEWQYLEKYFITTVKNYREMRKKMDAGAFVKSSPTKKKK